MGVVSLYYVMNVWKSTKFRINIASIEATGCIFDLYTEPTGELLDRLGTGKL